MSSALEGADGIIRPSSFAVSCPLGDGAAILDTRENRYFSLNPVGAFIWERVTQGVTVGSLIEAIIENFEVGEAECRSDTERLLAELAGAGLIDGVAAA